MKERGEMGVRTNRDGLRVAGALAGRLRELRRRAGLTQTEVAQRMELAAPGGQTRICSLERGEHPGTSLGVIAEYLRAVRAGFVDLLDILDGFTRRAPRPQERAARAIRDLELRMALRGEKVRIGEGRSREKTTETQRQEGMKGTEGTEGTKGGGAGWRL